MYLEMAEEKELRRVSFSVRRITWTNESGEKIVNSLRQSLKIRRATKSLSSIGEIFSGD